MAEAINKKAFYHQFFYLEPKFAETVEKFLNRNDTPTP